MSNIQTPFTGSTPPPSDLSDHEQELQGSYADLHKPSASFSSRDD